MISINTNVASLTAQKVLNNSNLIESGSKLAGGISLSDGIEDTVSISAEARRLASGLERAQAWNATPVSTSPKRDDTDDERAFPLERMDNIDFGRLERNRAFAESFEKKYTKFMEDWNFDRAERYKGIGKITLPPRTPILGESASEVSGNISLGNISTINRATLGLQSAQRSVALLNAGSIGLLDDSSGAIGSSTR